MLTAFKQYLTTLKLSAVSRKLYLADIRNFLTWLGNEPTLDKVASSETYVAYLNLLKSQAVAPAMLKRTIVSLRQFGTFVGLTYSLPNPTTSLSLTNPQAQNSMADVNGEYIKHFTNYLSDAQLSPLSVKSYKSDIARYLDWASSDHAGSSMNQLLNEKNIEKYLNYLSDSLSTLPSTIVRKSKSIGRFKAWYSKVYAPSHTPDSAPKSQVTSLVQDDVKSRDLSASSTSTAPDQTINIVKNNNYRKWYSSLVPNLSSPTLRNALSLAILLLFTATLGIFGYRQFSSEVRLTAAYPSTPVTPNRQLSFQGRLENAGGTPIATATNLTFKLWDDPSAGSQLYSSGVCSITPDSDGVFSTQIGDTCGSAIAATVFTENQDVWLEVTVAAETLTPRQQIATVAYALNSETLQGFPISSTVSAIRNTVVPMNQWGQILIGEQNPRMTGVSGTFAISAPALSLTTTSGSNGNITLAPDGTGQVNVNGNTTSTNFFNVSNAQLTTGSLITGTAANNNTGFKLIDLLSGSSPTSKFSVTDAGLTTVGADLYVNSGISTYGTAVSTGTIEATKFCTGDGETNCATDFSSFATGTNYWTRSAGNISPLTLNDTISATTSAATALTLTQTGAFNALLVEDQASDATPFIIDQSGNVGIGKTTANAALDVAGTASVSGTLTLGNGTTNTLRTPYGPLSLAYKSGLNAWTTGVTLQDTTGYVGIATTTPGYNLDVVGSIGGSSQGTTKYIETARNVTPWDQTFEENITNWSQINTTSFSQSTSFAYEGTNSLKIQRGSMVGSGGISYTLGTSLKAGRVYTLSGYYKMNNGSGTAAIKLNSDGAAPYTNGSSFTDKTLANTSNWTFFSISLTAATITTGNNYVWLGHSMPDTTQEIYFDDLVFSEGSIPQPTYSNQKTTLDGTVTYFGGNVGVGTSAPVGKFDITDISNTAASLSLTNNTATTIGNGANTLGVIDLQSTTLSTGNFLNLEVNGLTSGKGLNLTSTSTGLTTGSLFNVTASGNPGATWTGALGTFEYVTSTDADIDGSALKVGITGAGAGDGTALNVTTAQTGTSAFALRVNDDGTYTDSTPFVVDLAGNVGVGDSTPSKLFVVGNGDLFQVDSSGNALAPTLALGTGTIARTDRLFDFNTSTALTSGSNYTGTMQRTLTGTLTGNITDSFGLYNGLTINATDGQYNHGADGIYSTTSLSNGNTIDTVRGLYSVAINNSTTLSPDTGATATTSAAIQGQAYNNAAGIVTNQYGGAFYSYNNSTGSITNARGITTAAYNNDATGTITSAYGALNAAYTNIDAASITTAYGTYGQSYEFATQSSGGITTNYGGFFKGEDATTSYGLYAQGIQNTANTETFTNLYGVYTDCSSNGANVTVTNCYGVRSNVLETSGTITNGYGGYFSSSATMSLGYGVYANLTGNSTTSVGFQSNITGAGTNNYGANLSVTGAATTNYGVYTTVSGAGTNYAAVLTGGNVGIGDTTPDAALDVVGDIYISNGLSLYETTVSDGTVEATKYCTGDGETNCITDFSTIVAGATYWTRSAGDLYPTSLNDTISATTSAATALTLTQTGAFNALLVEDQASDTSPFVIDQSGNVGVGDASPDAKTEILSTTEQLRLTYTDGTVDSRFTLDSSGNLNIDNTGTKTTIADDLEITGDDLIMGTNTSGYLLIADGTNFNPTAVSGDISIDGTGLTAIGADKVTEAMLKSVNAATDEYCLTFESSVGDFEWQSCGSGAGGSNWRYNLGALSPINDTVDLLIGANATSSAKFAFINVNSGTPTATISANTANNASYLKGTGFLGTTNKQTLTLGEADTGNIVLAPGGTTALTGVGANLTAAGNVTIAGTTGLTFSGVGGDITFTNGEKLDNDTDGSLNVTATTLELTGGTTIHSDQTTVSLLNTTTTTLNLGGAATTINEGPTGSGASSILFSGGSADTGCTIDGSNGNLTCSGIIAGSAATSKWNGITNPDGNLSLTHAAFTTTMGWTSSAGLDAWTMNFNNNSGSSTTQDAMVINNAVVGSFTDTATENLLLLQQLDTTAAGTTAVTNALKIDSAGNSAITNGITITNSAGNMTTGINIADTAGGTLTTGIAITGTVTNAMDAGNFPIINIGNSATDFDTSGGLTLAGNLVVRGTTGLTFNTGAGGDITFANLETIDNDVNGTVNIGTAILKLTGGTSVVTDQTSFDLYNTTTTTLNIGGATTTLNLAGGSGSTGCTIDSSGNLTCSGNVTTTATTGSQGWWTRTAGNLYPTNLNDTLSATTSAAVAMTLTQTGAFNALLVEDQASDATPFIIDQSGNVGIGKTTANAALDVAGTASVSGTLTLGDGTTNTLRTPYGPLSLAYKSGLDTWTTGLTLQDTTGNVGIGTTAPDKRLEVNSATGANMRLTYNDADGSAANYADFSMSSSGDLTIAPSGFDLAVTGSATVAGNVTMGGELQLGRFAATPTAVGPGTQIFNTTTNSFQCYDGTTWYNCMGSALYSNTNASVADGSYITVTHSLSSNDLLTSGWINAQSTWKLLDGTYKPAIAWEGKDTERGVYHDQVNLYKPSEETNQYTENTLQSGLLFDTFEDSTKTDNANTTSSIGTQIGDDGSANYMTLTSRQQTGRTGLLGGQTYNSSTTDNDSHTYIGSNTINDLYYYDRTKDSSPAVQVELGIDPNWYNGVTLTVATASAQQSPQYSQNGTIPDVNPNLTESYNGSLIKVTGTDSTPRTIYITIKSPTTFDWTNYQGDAATGVTMTPGTAQTLGDTGVSITFTAANYNVGDVFRIASWFIEGSSSNRGSRQQFPERSTIIISNSYLSIIDNDTQKLWMSTYGNPGSTTSINILFNYNDSRFYNTVKALNGSVYVGKVSGNGDLTKIDFQKDTGLRATTTVTDQTYRGGISQRDSGMDFATTGNTSRTLVTNTVNDIDAAVIPNTTTQQVTVSGWGYINGASATTVTETVNLPFKFNSTPNIVNNVISHSSTTVPTSLESCNQAMQRATGFAQSITTSGFTERISLSDAADTNLGTNYYCYTWTATGTVSPKQFVAVATGATSADGGMSVINETDGTKADIVVGSQSGDNIWTTKVAMTGNDLYTTFNDSSGTPATALEVYYGVHGLSSEASIVANRSGIYWVQQQPSGWSASGPVIAGTASTASEIKSLSATSNTSTIDGTSNTIYVGTSTGVSVIQEKKGYGTPGLVADSNVEQSGSVKYYTKDYISEEMIGDVRGMWPFTDASGSLVDASIKGNFLEDENAPTYAVSAVRGTGLTFDNAADHLCSDANNDGTCDTDADYDFGTGSFSISTWFKHGTTAPASGTDAIIDHSYNTTPAAVLGWRVWMNSSATGTAGTISFGIDDDATWTNSVPTDDQATSTTTYNDNNWHHLVAVKDSTSAIYLYVDGQLVGSDVSLTATGTLTGAGVIMGVGADCSVGAACATGASFWDGQLDDLMITATAISAGQVKNMYQIGSRALQSHGTTLGGGSADLNQRLGFISTGTSSVGVVQPDLNNQYMYVGLNSTTLGGLSKIQLNSDTNIKTYNSSANVPTGGPLLIDEDVTSLGVGHTLNAVGSAASGVKSMGLDNNATATSGSFISKTMTLPKNIASAVLWVSPILDSSDGSNTLTVKASNDGGSNYATCTLVNTNSNPSVPEKEYACTFTASNNSLKVKFDFVRGSTKTNTYVTQYGISWLGQTGFRIEQADNNNVRLYNYSGETQNLKLNVSGATSSFLASPWTDGGTYLYPTNYESLRVYDGAGSNYLSLSNSGTAAQLGWNGTAAISIDSSGNVGIGTATPAQKLTVDGIVRIRQSDDTRYRSDHFLSAGGMTINAFDDTGSVYIPGTMRVSQLNILTGTAATVSTLYMSNANNVGIGNTSPNHKLQITGGYGGNASLVVDQTNSTGDIMAASASGVVKSWMSNDGYWHAPAFVDASSTSYYLDPGSNTTSLAILGDITNLDNATFTIASTSNNNIVIDAGSGTVKIGSAGGGKLDAGTIDPPYTINGDKFATYVSGMTGVKEETTGVALASEYVEGKGYRATIDLASSAQGSDIWLFSKVTDLKNHLDKMVVLLSSSGSGKNWYEIDAHAGKLYLYSADQANISYRLTAPRFDNTLWANTRDGDSTGFIVNDDNQWSVSDTIAGLISAGQTQIAALLGNLKTNLISPLAENTPIEITGSVHIQDSNPAVADLVVEGDIQASTISARVAILQDVEANTITAKNIVADTISANHIEGLDIKVASLSGNLSDSQITTITDRIKARLAALTGNLPTANDIPTPESTPSAEVAYTATSSANLASLDADFATINNYLAVIGQATITSLDVTANLYTNKVESKDGLLALQPTGMINMGNNTLIVDATGQVAINGDLTVNGKVLADSADFNTLSLGSPSSATSSALGQLLAIYNEAGEAVATIDASGSANLADLTTGMITITSPGSASTSAGLNQLTGTTSSNATAGEAVLVSPGTQITIESPYVTSNSLVYLTPTGNTSGKVLFVKSKTACDANVATPCTPSFTVGIDTPASSDISFNWWIIQLKP